MGWYNQKAFCQCRLKEFQMTIVRFDDVLTCFAQIVLKQWGRDALNSNLFLRDVSGRVTFVVLDQNRSSEDRKELGRIAASELQAYVDGAEFAVSTPEELFDNSLRQEAQCLNVDLTDEAFAGSVRLVDRRMVGADWLKNPSNEMGPPVRIVFGSIKGGVGRSTAICVIAAEFARQGKRVLAVDMDLEAPGLGSFLLSDDTLPEFGVLDYLVETEVGQELDGQFFADIIGPSWLSGGSGRVDVLPAIGKRSMAHPQNVLAKIARAYLAETTQQSGATFRDHIEKLVGTLTDQGRYDLVLIDARAGLHETTAAALLGLGADIFLFGIDQTQTYAGYELLFSHMKLLAPEPVANWLDRLTIVHAKASASQRSRLRFAEEMQEIVDSSRHSMKTQTGTDVAADLQDTFEVEWSDTADQALEPLEERSAVTVITIFEDEKFRGFDPSLNRGILSDAAYTSIYGEMLEHVRQRLDEQGRFGTA